MLGETSGRPKSSLEPLEITTSSKDGPEAFWKRENTDSKCDFSVILKKSLYEKPFDKQEKSMADELVLWPPTESWEKLFNIICLKLVFE